MEDLESEYRRLESEWHMTVEELRRHEASYNKNAVYTANEHQRYISDGNQILLKIDSIIAKMNLVHNALYSSRE